MARTLIIPDVHNQTAAVDALLAREEFDRAIFLGDYFDSSNDTPEDARATAGWLKERTRDPRMTFLYGNHDLPYRFPMPGTLNSAFTTAKRQAILDVLDDDDWGVLRLHAWSDGFLLTHAGWNRAFCDATGGVTRGYTDAKCAECLAELGAGRMHPLVAAGGSRGGAAHVPGIVWQDWSELEPVAGLHQIVGHTPGLEVRTKSADGGTAACLDTRLCHVGVIDNGDLSFRTTPVWEEWFGPQGRFPGMFG